MEYNGLKIGELSENGQVEIFDQDRLCYKVISRSKGAYGIRTISKGLLEEFYELYLEKPNITANEARDLLCGKSDIDKFEYGYASTLWQMAKMLDVNRENNKSGTSIKQQSSDKSIARQIIYYGAPGTGKSHKIKEQLEGVPKENIFRITFHPDSDYSTFVGAYKPTMEKDCECLYGKDELISKLTELKEQGVTYSPQKFGAKYWYSLKQLTLADKRDILLACGMSDNYTVEFDKGIAVGEELLKGTKKSRIVYNFIPQTFLNAYMQAYRKPNENVYLIIEEINRGNCAQIFGDLFQLLDRDENGVSEYTIKADADLKAFLVDEMGKDNDAIKDGELCLPSNLYIYATMNTSDQSLFPIDSAFKRRWDWEYEPIKYKNTDWVIEIQDKEYSWVSFQKVVNERIFVATNSEDKMLGDYFVNPSDGRITEKMLLNKILFYLWNDVCKDGERDIFKVGDTEDVSFSELYGDGGQQKLVDMMSYLDVQLVQEYSDDNDDDREDGYIDDNNINKDNTRYSINGGDSFQKTNLASELFKEYIKLYPELSVEDVISNWKSLKGKKPKHLIEDELGYMTFLQNSKGDKKKNEGRFEQINYKGQKVYLWKGWGDGSQGNVSPFMELINKSNWGITIKRV